MVIALGDLHLSDNRPWSYEVSKEIVKFITSSKYNVASNTLVLLGDLTESAFLSGMLYELLLNLMVGLKYKDIIILVGNHDKKPNKQGRLSLSYKFLQNKNIHKLFPNNNIQVIDSISELTLEGMNCLMLPYIFSDSGKDFSYYENLPEEYRKHYDIVFGHFTDNSDLGIKEKTVDVSYLNTDYWCLGHQHNPGSHYIGSIVPNSTSEANKVRSIQIFEKAGKVKRTLETIPVISDYYTVNFPEALPEVTAHIPIWTVLNCASEEIAQEQYGKMYIQKCIYKATMDIEGLQDIGALGGKELFTNMKLFEMWKETVKYDDDKILNMAEMYLNTV